MAKRKRDIQLKFRVTPQEREMIETKMAQFGTTNMAAYLRKMAIDGYVVKLDLPELRATGLQPTVIKNMLSLAMDGGVVDGYELNLPVTNCPDGKIELPCGCSGIWTKK